jgi:tripartite-type tricarboxylate transporter receptor subunit TctC
VWFALLAPAGTSAPVIAKLNALTNRILKDPAVTAVLNKAGLEPVGGTAEDMARLLKADTVRWAEVVKSAGIKIE